VDVNCAYKILVTGAEGVTDHIYVNHS